MYLLSDFKINYIVCVKNLHESPLLLDIRHWLCRIKKRLRCYKKEIHAMAGMKAIKIYTWSDEKHSAEQKQNLTTENTRMNVTAARFE